MDLKRIRYAVTLAEELNFGRAATRLHLSQPALSRGIQMLEEELDLVLFDRGTRAVAVTKVGARFLEHAQRVIHQMRSFELDMAQLRSGGIGHVAFGIGPTPTYSLMGPVLQALRRHQPQLRLTVDTNHAGYLLQHLRSESIEFLVADTRAMAHETDISITPLCRQRGAFICRPGHPLLSKPDLQPRDMLAHGFALGTWTPALLAQFRVLLGLAPDQLLPVVLESDNINLLKQLTAYDDAIMVVTHATVADDLEAGTLCALPLAATATFFAEIGIVHLKGRSLSTAADIVLQAIRAAAAAAPHTEMGWSKPVD
jgi:DNA-binding transcriptional LysR family regulator